MGRPLKGSIKFAGEFYWYRNPVTGLLEHRNTCETYDDEEKCKMCKHTFESKKE